MAAYRAVRLSNGAKKFRRTSERNPNQRGLGGLAYTMKTVSRPDSGGAFHPKRSWSRTNSFQPTTHSAVAEAPMQPSRLPRSHRLRPLRSPVAQLALAAIALAAWPVQGASDEEAVERYMGHVEFLASPEMRGRGAGMPELDEAAAYIARELAEQGVAPAGDGGTYLQPFEVTTGASMGENNLLRVERKRGVSELEPKEDFIPINFSGSGSVEGEVVFAGYGATAEEFDYDDYFHLDVKDKIVLVMRYEPRFFSEETSSEEGDQESDRNRRLTRHSHLIAKAIQARKRGARAVLLVNSRGRGRRGDRLIRFGSVSGPTDAGIPMVQVSSAIAEQWLRGSGRSLRVLERDIEQSERPQSFPLASSLRIRLSVDVEHERAMVSNVAGYLPGNSEEYLIIGAHYDHLGLGGEGSLATNRRAPHLGADDNASGVAAILELARSYARAGELERGILFLAFAGEEIGLLGSSHWVENPTLPLENAVAMFNFDMVGRIERRKLYVGGVGTAEPLEALVQAAASEHGLRVDKSKSGYSSSDHTSFAAKKIPVLFFFSGLHSDYHKPSDSADKIDGAATVEMLAMARQIIDGVAERAQRLVFVEDTPESGRGQRGGDGEQRGYGPWFGSIPDFGEVPNGVKFADVRAGSPAAQAGLQGGDILTRWNDAAITNLYDFTYALRDSKAGDVVTVRVLRGEQEVTAKVTLAPRP